MGLNGSKVCFFHKAVCTMRYLLVVIGALLAMATASEAKIIRLPSATVPSVVVGVELDTVVRLVVTEQLALGSSIISAEIRGEGSTSAFRVRQNTFRDTISIGKPFSVEVAFLPRAVGRHSGELLLLVGSKQQQSDSIIVTLTGIGVSLRVVPKTLDFGTVQRGVLQEKSFAIFNDGAQAIVVHLGSIEPPFRFSKAQTGQGLSVAAQGFTDVSVECYSNKPGTYVSQVVLTTASENTVRVSDTVELVVTVSEYSRETVLQFGSVVVGTSKEIPYVIRNPFGKLAEVVVENIEAGDAFEFVPPHRNIFTVPANDSATIFLRFTPQQKGGATTARFSMSSTIPGLTSVVVYLQGRGVSLEGISMEAGVVHANIGDVVALPLFVTMPIDVASELLVSNVDSVQCSFEMLLNSSIAYIAKAAPVDSTYYDAGEVIAHVRTTAYFSDDDTTKGKWPVATIPLQVLLGDVVSTPIKLRNVQWSYNGKVITRKTEVPEGEGKLVVDNIFTWPNGEKRLIAVRRGALELAIVPNPMGEQTTIDASGFTGRAVLSIYTPLGEQVFAKTMDRPSSFTFSRSETQGIAPGLYYCRLSAGRYSLVKLLRVE